MPDKRIIKGRPFGVGFDRSHHHLQGAPSCMTPSILGWTVSISALGNRAAARSHLINHMPPRTTRKSYRPRVSDRTMVDTLRPSCLLRQKAGDSSRHKMTLRNVETNEPLTPLLRLDDKKTSLLPVEAEAFFLTSPFIECVYRTLENSKMHLSGNPTNHLAE